MALVKCRECGKKNSRKASGCPRCRITPEQFWTRLRKSTGVNEVIIRTVVVTALLFPLAGNAAVYKCQNGRTATYQDRSCAGASSSENEVKVRSDESGQPHSGQAPRDNSISKWLAKSEEEDRRRELELKLTKLEKQNHAYEVDRDSKLAQLQTQKRSAINHVAGSGNESAISRQMDEISTGYDQKIRQNQVQVAAMKKQLDNLR